MLTTTQWQDMREFFSGAFFIKRDDFLLTCYLACVSVPILSMGFTATLKCDNVKPGRGSGSNYVNKGSIPGLVQLDV